MCQLPDESKCLLKSNCKAPLTCARDLQCRVECAADVDCAKSQKCVETVCADQAEINGDKLKDQTPIGGGPDAGASMMSMVPGQGGATGAGGASAGPMDSGAGAGGMTAAGIDAARATDSGSGPAGPMDMAAGPGLPPVAEGVTIDKATARQGETGIKITVGGKNLTSPTGFQLGGLTVFFDMSSTDTVVKLTVTVPHGTPLGPKALSFTTSGGTIMKADVITITPITVSPMGMDANRGTADAPYRTFKQALQVADAGDTIELKDGKYSMATGETWDKSVPDKVTIVGQSAAGTQMVGPASEGGSASLDGLRFDGSATVKNLSIGFFRYGIVTKKPGDLVLENIKIPAGQYGVYVESEAVGVKISISGKETDFLASSSAVYSYYAPGLVLDISGAGTIGTLANANAINIAGAKSSVSISGVTVTTKAGGYGALSVTGADSTVKVEKAMFKEGIVVSHATSTLSVSGTTVTMPKAAGTAITFGGSKMTLTGVMIDGGVYGVQQSAGAAVVRGSTFNGYSYYGYYLTAGTLDLGTMVEAGNNTFKGPATGGYYGLYDARPAVAATPITVSASTFNDAAPPAKEVKGPVNVMGQYYIYTAGNVIAFY